MFAALSIGLILIGLVAAILGFGPNCLEFMGTDGKPLTPVCLGPQGQFALIVVAVLCAIGVAFIFGTAKARKRKASRR
jgi:hypothetical protein